MIWFLKLDQKQTTKIENRNKKIEKREKAHLTLPGAYLQPRGPALCSPGAGPAHHRCQSSPSSCQKAEEKRSTPPRECATPTAACLPPQLSSRVAELPWTPLPLPLSHVSLPLLPSLPSTTERSSSPPIAVPIARATPSPLRRIPEHRDVVLDPRTEPRPARSPAAPSPSSSSIFGRRQLHRRFAAVCASPT